jgi:hypothetical protein
MEKTRQEIEEWAGSRETSTEIAMSIFEIAEGEEEANAIWQDGQFKNSIKKRAIELSREKSGTLHWGEETIIIEEEIRRNGISKIAYYGEQCNSRAGKRCWDQDMIDNEDNDIIVWEVTEENIDYAEKEVENIREKIINKNFDFSSFRYAMLKDFLNDSRQYRV